VRCEPATSHALSFEERQQVLRLVVERITVVDGMVRVEAIVPTGDDYDTLRALRGERVEPPAGEVADQVFHHL
jgi:hypothetical protein